MLTSGLTRSVSRRTSPSALDGYRVVEVDTSPKDGSVWHWIVGTLAFGIFMIEVYIHLIG